MLMELHMSLMDVLLLKMMIMISGSDFEQEYFIMDRETQLPLGFPIGGYPGPQGMYYCSVGGKNTFGRDFVEEHADLCIEAGLNFEGINQEVASGQWEFQLFAKGAKKAGDEIWIARYLLDRLTEKFGWYIEYHPKPIKGDWNGSGMHANFSNTILRECGSAEKYAEICEAFRPVTKEHIEVYGDHNDQRLTGLHETASINDFSWGVSDRGASIRIPIIAVEKGYKGWLEDSSSIFKRRSIQNCCKNYQNCKTSKIILLHSLLLKSVQDKLERFFYELLCFYCRLKSYSLFL